MDERMPYYLTRFQERRLGKAAATGTGTVHEEEEQDEEDCLGDDGSDHDAEDDATFSVDWKRFVSETRVSSRASSMDSDVSSETKHVTVSPLPSLPSPSQDKPVVQKVTVQSGPPPPSEEAEAPMTMDKPQIMHHPGSPTTSGRWSCCLRDVNWGLDNGCQIWR